MPENNARLTVRLSPVTSNIEPSRYLSLVVEDAASGQRIVQIALLGDALLDLFSGRQVGDVEGLPAYLIEESERVTLGKTRTNTSRRFSAASHTEGAVTQWAERNAVVLGAHSFSVKRNNSAQYVALFTYYADVPEGRELETWTGIKQAAMDVLSTPHEKL
jgi:hypothetical protein